MLWTKVIKVVHIFLFFIEVIGSLILYNAYYEKLGMYILLGGLLFAVLSNGLILVICEISENIYFIGNPQELSEIEDEEDDEINEEFSKLKAYK